jgi:hypothetical protein
VGVAELGHDRLERWHRGVRSARRLNRALANASSSELLELAARWTMRLKRADGDDMTDDDPLAILQELPELAASAVSSGNGLYCWSY